MLEIDVDGAGQGTRFDHLAVGGAASLDGTVALVKGAGFDPAASDTLPVPHLRVADAARSTR